MAQDDQNVANAPGASVRADINSQLEALITNSSGATEPSTTWAYQFWADTTTGLLKIRNAANNAWVIVGTLASANLGLIPTSDIGSVVQAYDGDIPTVVVSQAEAEAGTSTANRTFTPERVKQAIEALTPFVRFGGDYVKLSDVKSTGTAGGSSIAGTQVRTLNTEDADSAGICTLSANQFTLQAGTYQICASSQSYRSNRTRTLLHNVSDAVVELLGANEISDVTNNGNCTSFVRGEFTIASPKTFELRMYTTLARGGDGLGNAIIDGRDEVYAVVELWRVVP